MTTFTGVIIFFQEELSEETQKFNFQAPPAHLSFPALSFWSNSSKHAKLLNPMQPVLSCVLLDELSDETQKFKHVSPGTPLLPSTILVLIFICQSKSVQRVLLQVFLDKQSEKTQEFKHLHPRHTSPPPHCPHQLHLSKFMRRVVILIFQDQFSDETHGTSTSASWHPSTL